MVALYRRTIDRIAYRVSGWLASRAAFIQVCVATLISVPLTIFAIDPHGFTYLYIATALSLVTQVPLAMIGQRAREEAHKAEQASARTEESQIQMLQNQADTLRAILTLLERDTERGTR